MNVIPNTIMLVLTLDGITMKPNALIVKVFDGYRQAVIREVDLTIRICPHTLSITFQVKGIHLRYSFLLGRPRIHAVGAVTSMLHRKLKFIIDNKMIVMDREEYILVIHLSFFRYIDINGETIETPLQALEVVSAVAIHPVEEHHKYELSMASWKGAKSIVEAGNAMGWGKVLEIPKNKDRFGMGY